MSLTTPLRFSLWFESDHIPYGGPGHVLISTIMGLIQNNCIILINEIGDINMLLSKSHILRKFDMMTRGTKRLIGPLTFEFGDAHVTNKEDHPLWKIGSTKSLYVIPSLWYARWVCNGLPFDNPEHKRTLAVWGSGVNTDYFTPIPKSIPRKHDYFVYFKSQKWDELASMHEYLFMNYFKLHGPTLVYYFYNHEEMKEVAQNAKFCIFMSSTETQGLASLEIMACGCPLFVVDQTKHINGNYAMDGATSVTCWNNTCGVKSSMANLAKDFPLFIEKLESYNPRSFVEREYSWKASAGKLLHYANLVETS